MEVPTRNLRQPTPRNADQRRGFLPHLLSRDYPAEERSSLSRTLRPCIQPSVIPSGVEGSLSVVINLDLTGNFLTSSYREFLETPPTAAEMQGVLRLRSAVATPLRMTEGTIFNQQSKINNQKLRDANFRVCPIHFPQSLANLTHGRVSPHR